MKTRTFTILILPLIFIFSMTQAFSYVAIPLDCLGVCKLVIKDGEQKIRTTTELAAGSVVKTEKDSQLYLLFLNGTLLRLGPESQVTLNDLLVDSSKSFIEIEQQQGSLLLIPRLAFKRITKADSTQEIFPLENVSATPEGIKFQLEKKLLARNLSLYSGNYFDFLNTQITTRMEKNNQNFPLKGTHLLVNSQNGILFSKDAIIESFVTNTQQTLTSRVDVEGIKGLNGNVRFYHAWDNFKNYDFSEGDWLMTQPSTVKKVSVKDVSTRVDLLSHQLYLKSFPSLFYLREIALSKLQPTKSNVAIKIEQKLNLKLQQPQTAVSILAAHKKEEPFKDVTTYDGKWIEFNQKLSKVDESQLDFSDIHQINGVKQQYWLVKKRIQAYREQKRKLLIYSR